MAFSRATTKSQPTIRRTAKQADLPVQFLQDDIAQSFSDLLKGTPFQTGLLVSINFSSGLDQTVPHKLGTKARGAFPVDVVGAAASFYRLPPSDAKQAGSHVRIVASVACAAVFWVWA